jgi:predicted DNA-binding ribbon-helix-helix protein
MCQLFINADNQLWAYTTISLRIDGVVTSCRVETFLLGNIRRVIVS